MKSDLDRAIEHTSEIITARTLGKSQSEITFRTDQLQNVNVQLCHYHVEKIHMKERKELLSFFVDMNRKLWPFINQDGREYVNSKCADKLNRAKELAGTE